MLECDGLWAYVWDGMRHGLQGAPVVVPTLWDDGRRSSRQMQVSQRAVALVCR